MVWVAHYLTGPETAETPPITVSDSVSIWLRSFTGVRGPLCPLVGQ